MLQPDDGRAEDSPAGGRVYFCGLWYVNEYVRTDRGWRIARRVEELSYKFNEPDGWG